MKSQVAEIEAVSKLFKVLGDPTRLKILLALQNGPLNVTKIAEELQMEQSAVSHQLKILRDNRLVHTQREGKIIYYQLDDNHVVRLLEQTFEHMKHQ
ncbi:MAG: ArsR/SmtB family transcription factor [Enterococcus sp.]